MIGSCRAGFLGGFVTAAYRIHRAPMPEEYEWHISFRDEAGGSEGCDFYYVRVRRKNDRWAWSSPSWVA
ncbi:hypothetical protein DRP77_07460 [Candidatus Poribacteria bacterium]|nr:MAG: hypothetical protein DRP77_07460 [Candidatus Poribacteria bacterium]